ncbi:MAG: hypothetical protein ABH859_03085 [Pseudomonadota bacterium]
MKKFGLFLFSVLIAGTFMFAACTKSKMEVMDTEETEATDAGTVTTEEMVVKTPAETEAVEEVEGTSPEEGTSE